MMLDWAVVDYFDVHTHRSFVSSPSIMSIFNQVPFHFDPDVRFFSMGIHPWWIDPILWRAHLESVESKLEQSSCLALGECGLDKVRGATFELQIEVFEAQLALAKSYRMPLLIHCVGAFQELMALKKRHSLDTPIVIHGFNKNRELASQLIEQGFYLSIGGSFFKKTNAGEILKGISIDKLFFETDDSIYEISEIYEKAAAALGIPLNDLSQSVVRHAQKVFSK